MPCDGKNPNCDRRRELLAQLKCLISSMDRKKPCEWDEPGSPVVCCPAEGSLRTPPCCVPVRPCKSFDFRASIMYRCECIKRNGLQDRCMMWDCMGRPECMTKLYPVCEPGRAALLKLTDLGDVEVALRKFYCADQAREAALAAYCRLVCDNARRKRAMCGRESGQCADETSCAVPKCTYERGRVSDCDNASQDSCCKPAPCNAQSSAYRVYAPSPANPACCVIPDTCCVYCPPPPMRLPYCPPPCGEMRQMEEPCCPPPPVYLTSYCLPPAACPPCVKECCTAF